LYMGFDDDRSHQSLPTLRTSDLAYGMRLTSLRPPRMMSLARSWIQVVASEPAGPPLGGLYLNPPSAGGLWEGVTTTPSARGPAGFRRLWVRMACETAGVGV